MSVAIEADLNGIIQEYLSFYGFDSTLKTFLDECNRKGKSVADVGAGQNAKLINEMINLFHHGQQKEFFRLWNEYIPIKLINQSIDAQKLELELNIHFAVYPFRIGSKNKQEIKDSLATFKDYIENKGRVLCQTKEFKPYFVLPYHPNPPEEFPELFQESWVVNLQRKLEKFLHESMQNYQATGQPRLIELYSNQADSDQTFNIAKLRQQLNDSEKRAMSFMRKFTKASAEYHSLIGLTADLVDTLENSINGKPVSPQYIERIMSKIVNNQLKQTIDLTRPGTAGEYIRKSLAVPRSNTEKIEVRKTYPPLDFKKLKHDLINQSDKRKILLLQALRWRLTKADTVELRHRELTSYIASDLLSFRSERITNNFIDLLKSPNSTIREFMARLINALASLNHGRSYLTSNLEMVKVIIQTLRDEEEDTYTKKNLFAALQKLSLRYKAQMLMIHENVIDYLTSQLQECEKMSDYSLEYATALIMNLVMKKAGKKKVLYIYPRLVKVLSELIGSENLQQYVNAALYHILSIPQVKEHAREINLESILRNYLTDEDTERDQALAVMIIRINSDSSDHVINLDEEEDVEDEDEDEDEDAELMEMEIDSGESIKPPENEYYGEALLVSEYMLNNNHDMKLKFAVHEPVHSSGNDQIINRPVTPHRLRQSQSNFNGQQGSKPPASAQTSGYSRQKNIPKEPNLAKQSFSLKNTRSNSQNNMNSSFTVVTRLDGENNHNPNSYYQFRNGGSNGSGADILVIEDSSIDYENNKFNHVNDSIGGNFSRANRSNGNKASINSVNSSNGGTIQPKYSISEPRPSSSSNSLKNL